jgi:hypothetical protein
LINAAVLIGKVFGQKSINISARTTSNVVQSSRRQSWRYT